MPSTNGISAKMMPSTNVIGAKLKPLTNSIGAKLMPSTNGNTANADAFVKTASSGILMLFSKQQIGNKECKGDDAEDDEHRYEHHPHRAAVGLPLLLEGCAGAAATVVSRAADSRHIGDSSAVVDIGYLLLFLFSLFAHFHSSSSR